MPLKYGSSNKTRASNIRKEVAAGKSPKQAAAIGYAVQRRAKGKHDVQHPRRSNHSGDK